MKRTPCLVLQLHMRNSTGSPIFSDFQSDLSRVAVSRPLVKGNEDAGYEGGKCYFRLRNDACAQQPKPQDFCGRDLMLPRFDVAPLAKKLENSGYEIAFMVDDFAAVSVVVA